MNILILGGTGILSTDVCKYAISRGYTVTCITRGNRPFALPEGAININGDANDLNLLSNQLDYTYDAVIDFLTFNADQLKRKMEFFNIRCKQYFFISSATAYKNIDTPITEDTPLGNQYWDYGQNKVECERYLFLNKHSFQCKFTIIRPYVTYGNTRIPFAIIPDGCYWSLANRILCDKPVLLWDDGKAICTITHTSDFARGVIGLIGKEASYGEAFHVTSNEKLTWKKVLEIIGEALSKNPITFSTPTSEIIKVLPEYTGVLLGDKARNKVFDNTKIINVVPEFARTKTFAEGIEETIHYYQNNVNERRINYLWDGKIDRAIIDLSRKLNINIDKSKLKFLSQEKNISFKNRLQYYIGRYKILFTLYCMLKSN